MSNKFKINGVGLDTTSSEFELDDTLEFDYVHTSISSNNGYLLKTWLSNSISPVFTSIDFLDSSRTAIVGHLEEIGRDKINLLLVNASCDFEKYQEELKSLLADGLVEEIGIKQPESVEQLEKLKTLFKFKIVSLNLSPLEFNYDVIKWCEDNNVKIFGFNPFGGKLNAPRMINGFTLPYLLNFTAAYSSLVFLSGSMPYRSDENRKYLYKLIGKGLESNIYELQKNVNKLMKPLNKVISLSLEVDTFTSVTIDDPDSIFDINELKLTMGKAEDKFNNDEKKTLFEEEMFDIVADTKFPEDTTKDEDVLSVILPNIRRAFKSRGYLLQPARLSSNTIILAASIIKKTRKFLKRKVEVDTKFYIINYKSGIFSFQKVNNSSLMD